MPNASELLLQHTSLSIRCVDRLYLNGYLPTLLTGSQVRAFLRRMSGQPIASPALLRGRHERFVQDVKQFAASRQIDVVEFERGARKDDLAAKYRKNAKTDDEVLFIGTAQERCHTFRGSKLPTTTQRVDFDFVRSVAFVNHYYFYVMDPQWGPAFIKLVGYLPYPIRLCLNGHEWAKQQLKHAGVGFQSLDNGFVSCQDPQFLQQTCDSLESQDVIAFYHRWADRLPWPMTAEERKEGHEHRISIWQLEASQTDVFDHPARGRAFFDSLMGDNLDIGRPDRVSVCFPVRLTRATPMPRHGYRTTVVSAGVTPVIHAAFKHSDVKQYLKQGRALRTETTISDTHDLKLNKGIENLGRVRDAAQTINTKLLEHERVADDCVIGSDALDSLQAPRTQDGQRVGALRFGDGRAMALFAVLCAFTFVPAGFRNRDLVTRMKEWPIDGYTTTRASYDLRRLRLHGLIEKQLGSHAYQLTPIGRAAVHFLTKLHRRLLRPAGAALKADSSVGPQRLRKAIAGLERAISRCCDDAGLKMAA